MIGETQKVLICMSNGNIFEVINEENGQNLDFEIVENNDYLGEN